MAPSCVALVVAVVLVVILNGVASGRIGSWFDFNPFGVIAKPDTQINDQRPAVVLQMQSLARLKTMNCTIEQVIEAEKGGNAFQDLFFGDRILLIAHGTVIAGVDLRRLNDEDVGVTAENAITVTLPVSENFVATLDNEAMHVYDREQGLLSRGDAQIETKARQAAEASILQATCEHSILDQALPRHKPRSKPSCGCWSLRP